MKKDCRLELSKWAHAQNVSFFSQLPSGVLTLTATLTAQSPQPLCVCGNLSSVRESQSVAMSSRAITRDFDKWGLLFTSREVLSLSALPTVSTFQLSVSLVSGFEMRPSMSNVDMALNANLFEIPNSDAIIR